MRPSVATQDISWDYDDIRFDSLLQEDENRTEFKDTIAVICDYGWFLSLGQWLESLYSLLCLYIVYVFNHIIFYRVLVIM